MSTRAQITVKTPDTCYLNIYLHRDGHPEHALVTLREHYSTADRAAELVSHGDLSSLAPRCDSPAGHSFSNPVDGRCVYYGRDRGETGTEAEETEAYEKWDHVSHCYLFDGESWSET